MQYVTNYYQRAAYSEDELPNNWVEPSEPQDDFDRQDVESLLVKFKMMLKNHDRNNSLSKTLQLSEEVNVNKIKKSGFKQEILMNDSVQIDASVMYYRVKFKHKLKSEHYQIYGSLTTTSGQQIREKIIKFKEINIFGFSVIIENILDKNVKVYGKININWMLVGNPEIIEFENPYEIAYESSYARNSIVETGKKTIDPNNEPNWEINFDTIPKLPSNAVFACTFKYPLPDNEPSFMASIKSYDDENVQEITIGQFCNITDYAPTRTQLSNVTTKKLVVPSYNLIDEIKQDVLPESVSNVSCVDASYELIDEIINVSCVDASYKLIDEIKDIILNLKKSKKIFDPLIYSSIETIRALHYVKHEVELYFQQYEDVFNEYKISLENIKEFAKEIANIEKSFYLFYPYRHVKEKYKKLLKDHEDCEKKLNPILIKIIMNKQESQQEDLLNINKILKAIPNDNKNENTVQVETIVQNLIERSFVNISVPRIDSASLFDPPIVGNSRINSVNEPDRKSELDLDDSVRTKHIIKKIYKCGMEVACEPVTIFEQNMSILNELKRFDECRNILRFYGLSKIDDVEMLVFEWASLGSLKNVYEKKQVPWDLKVNIAYDICQGLLFLSYTDIFHRDIRCENIMMNCYMEPKIANFYLAKHTSEIGSDNEDHISEHILNIINWSAPEMMQKNALYTRECEIFSFVMLLWELAFQRIPYEQMSKEDIIVHVTNDRRETPNLPFYTFEFLNIQRKYLKIIAEGWDNEPEKRIKMDEILSRFSDIKAEFTKLKRSNSGSVSSSDQLDQLSNVRTRAASISVDPSTHYKRHQIPLKPKESESKPDKHTIPNSPGFHLSPRINYPKKPKKFRPSSIMAPNLESVNEMRPPYLTETPNEIDSFMTNPETCQIERPSKVEPSNVINPLPPRSPIMSSVNEASNKTSNLIKPDEVIGATNKTSNLVKSDKVFEVSNKTSSLIKPDEVIETPNMASSLIKHDEVIKTPNKTSNSIKPDVVIKTQNKNSSLIKPDEVIETQNKTSSLVKPDEVIETPNKISSLIKPDDEVTEVSDKPSNSIKTETIEKPNEVSDLTETKEVNGIKQSTQSNVKVIDETKPLHKDDDYDKKSLKSENDDFDLLDDMKISEEAIFSDNDNDDGETILPEETMLSENDDPILSDNEEMKSSEKPAPQNLQDIPGSIIKKLNHGLIINKKKMQIAVPSACDFTSKPKMNVLDAIIFQAKLIISSTYKDSFLLENHIESSTDDLDRLEWISNTDPQNNISQTNTVYLEIGYPKAEATFERDSIKPSKELTGAIKKALNNKNPYRELMKVFEKFGYFLPSKVILGDKVYSISKHSSVNQESTELKINKEFKTADEFSPKCADYNDIMTQWGKCIESHKIDSSTLTSITGNAVKRNKVKDWAISCLKKSPDSWNIISWKGLYPLYEILDADLCQEVKSCLGHDEQAISTGIKEKVLRSGVIQITNSQYQYPVKFNSSLESENYQIFGKILTQGGTPSDNVYVKFKSKDKSGFLAIVEVFSEDKSLDNLQITWVLIGIPSEVGIFDSNTRNIPVLCANRHQFALKPTNDIVGIDVQLKTSERLQTNSVIITSFKYPKSTYKQTFTAKVKDYRDKTIHISIRVREDKESVNENDEEDFVEIPELHWCVLLFEDEDDNLREIGQSIYANYLNSGSENDELDLSYKKLNVEIGKELVNVLKGNKTINSLDISYNNIGSGLGKALMYVLVNNDTLTRLNLSSTYIESDTLALLLKILKNNKTRLADLNLSNNGDKFTKRGKMLMETLGKNTTLINLNLSNNHFDWTDVNFTPLVSNKTLENLDLSNCNLSPKVIEKLRKFLITSKRLKGLNLNKGSKTTLTGRYKYKSKSKYDMARTLKITNLTEALKINKSLKKLDLSSNYIRLEAGKDLAKALMSNKFITELNLNDNDVVRELSESLIDILISNNITSIGLRSTKISPEMVIKLSQGLKSNKIKLRYLNLSRNEISSDAMEELVEALEENTSLKNLDLSNITGAGQIGRELTKSLEKNRTLKTLNLSNCNIRNGVVNALKKALQTNDTLTDLDLSYNALPMNNLMKALETNKSLTKLNISHRDFHLEEVEALANALKINNTLTHLYISKTMDDPEIGNSLFEALEVNEKLTDLDLSSNKIKEIEIITKALLNNVSLRRVDLTSNQLDYD
ncbi:44810_t:CDS:10, partial [Gigaspora margarita]